MGSMGLMGMVGDHWTEWLVCQTIKREGARYKECRLQMLLTVHRAGWLYVSRVQVAGLNLRRFECLGFFSALHPLLFSIFYTTVQCFIYGQPHKYKDHPCMLYLLYILVPLFLWTKPLLPPDLEL